jgi:ATP-binding cassette subfamily E protein 1
MLESKATLGNLEQIIDDLELHNVLERRPAQLSGGEMQRFAIAMTCVQKADVCVSALHSLSTARSAAMHSYMFDEPSSFLDVKQRLKAARTIRSLLSPEVYVICVEHDLSVLDYLSDFICCLYGHPSIYGVVTMPYSSREGINIFLDGHIPTENLRFRQEALTFRIAETGEELEIQRTRAYSYPDMTKKMGDFTLSIEAGRFTDSEIIVLLGENGTGALVSMHNGLEYKREHRQDDLCPNARWQAASRRCQGSSPAIQCLDEATDHHRQGVRPAEPPTSADRSKFEGSVRMLLIKRIKAMFMCVCSLKLEHLAHKQPRRNAQFNTDVIKPMQIEQILDQEVQTLSGGELQRVAIVLCLGTRACRRPRSEFTPDGPLAQRPTST